MGNLEGKFFTWFDYYIIAISVVSHDPWNPTIQIVHAFSNVSYCEMSLFISLSPKLIALSFNSLKFN